MSGGNEFHEAALWRRWRDAQAGAGEAAAEPDALTLAAYAEDRLGRPGSDPEIDPAIAAVEAWLLDRPEALDDLVAARAAQESDADAALIARSQSLIARPSGNVVALRPARPAWQNAMAWSGIAASLVAAVLIGFSFGTDEAVDLSDAAQTPVLEQALTGPASIILAPDDEDAGI
jgi:hypothetical protein